MGLDGSGSRPKIDEHDVTLPPDDIAMAGFMGRLSTEAADLGRRRCSGWSDAASADQTDSDSARRSLALSSDRNASMMSSKRTGALGPFLSAGAASTAHASDAQDAKMARFSLRVRSGSFTTSDG